MAAIASHQHHNQGLVTMKDHGLTFVELLASLFIIAILMAVASPGLFTFLKKTKLQVASRALMESIENARSKAVFLNQRTVLQATPEWKAGWILFLDKNDNGIQNPDEPLLLEQQILSGVKIRDNFPTSNQISFIGTGESRKPGRINSGAFIAGTIKICPDTEGEGVKLVLNRAGRLRSEKITAEECNGI